LGLRLNSELLFPTVGHKPPVGTIDDRSELPSPVATIKFDRPFIFAVEQYRDDDIGTHCLCIGCYRGDQAEGLQIFPPSTSAKISRSEYYKAQPSGEK